MDRESLVNDAVASGISFVCATCDHYWRAVSLSAPSCSGASISPPCRGPIGGGSFRHYSGPIVNSKSLFCFVCGDKSDAAIEVKSTNPSIVDGSMVGVCNKHISMLNDFSRGSESPVFVTHKSVEIKR